MTCADAQRVASCVSEGEALKDMKKVGSHGKLMGNVTRDFLRMAKSNLKCELPELFEATVEVFDNKGGVAEEKISMLLPTKCSHGWEPKSQNNLTGFFSTEVLTTSKIGSTSAKACPGMKVSFDNVSSAVMLPLLLSPS